MKIFIPTSNKTIHLVETLLISLEKYWPEFESKEVIILGYDDPKFTLPSNVSFVKINNVDNVKNWAIDLKNYFESIEDEYFIYMNDDCPLSRNVDNELLDILLQIPTLNDQGDIGRICLTKDVSNRRHTILGDYESFQIIEAAQDTRYRTSVQFSIWSKKYFCKYAKENMTPWEFELQNSTNDGYKILATRGRYCLDFYHLMRKNGIPSDWNISCYEKKQLETEIDEYNTIKKIMGL